MKLVTEEQKKPPNKRDISSTDFVGLFVDFSFEVMPEGNAIYQISKVAICRDLRDVDKKLWFNPHTHTLPSAATIRRK